jgi:3-methyladenine DNA glycosylase AlkD
VLEVASLLLASHSSVPRWFVYELIHCHPAAMAELDAPMLNELGRGISSWGDVDSFAGYLAGEAWKAGQISDAQVHEWARREDRWWRRAALVSTVPLNRGTPGGRGDSRRTVEVCELLKADRDDMVVKAFSWALRELAKRDPDAVRRYLGRASPDLAARVVREVVNKLETGLKNPPGGRRGR